MKPITKAQIQANVQKCLDRRDGSLDPLKPSKCHVCGEKLKGEGIVHHAKSKDDLEHFVIVTMES